MSNVTINNFNKINFKVSNSEYWDLTLSKEKDPDVIMNGSSFCDDGLILNIDLNDSNCISDKYLLSSTGYTWSDSYNHGLNLTNIGFNGIDTGIVPFYINNITSDDFYVLVTGSSLNISTGDTRLLLKTVSGNTGNYTYPISIESNNIGNYIKLDGGFYQGFFKSGENYLTLPYFYENEITFEFMLKPDFIAIPQSKTLNYKYPDNKGIFFYIGPRSENKFWYEYYKTDAENYTISKTGRTTPYNGDLYFKTTDGFNTHSQNVYKIQTDNKYLLFNRTKNGLLASNYDSNDIYYTTGYSNNNVNYFNYVNRTSTGYTASNISTITGQVKEYNIIDDIVNNVIAFRIKDDGSIGYRTIILDCSGTTDYVLYEEYSQSDLIKDNEISIISIKFIMSENLDCTSNRTFTIWFYVNGKLVFVSEELPELIFRPLNDTSEKQESVPYNISVGGGSQGLCDLIGFNDNYTNQYLLPIEKYFAGSIIGELYDFKIFYDNFDYSKIYNNYLYRMDKLYNPQYMEPDIYFWITGYTNYPETINKREIGNTVTILNANIILRDVYSPLTGYNLYYYVDDSNRVQINGLFPIAQSGGTISPYVHDDYFLSQSGSTNIRYVIEIMDTYNTQFGTEKVQTINFDYFIFYGGSETSTITPTEIRELNRVFNDETTNFYLDTGSRNNVFIIALPNDREIFKVLDETVLFLDITHLFTKNVVQIPDAGGNLVDYNVYILENAIPYSRNHKFIITLT